MAINDNVTPDIFINFQKKPTLELEAILKERNLDESSEEAFVAAERVLEQRKQGVLFEPISSPKINKQPNQQPNQQAELIYAGFWLRVFAHLIDEAVLFIMIIILFIILFAIFGVEPREVSETSLNIITIILGWLYFTLLESSSNKATFGKQIIGIVVTDANGEQISFWKANVRHWFKIVSALTLMLGFIMAALTPKKEALHDMMAETLVVKEKKE